MLSQTRRLFQSPADDVLTAILNEVNAAQHTIRIIDYAWVWPDLTALVIAKHAAGVDVRMVLDKTQAAGPSERPEVAQLQAAGVPLVTGHSERSRIIHDKVIVIDGSTVIRGSFNLTMTAQLEDNEAEIDTGNPTWAAAFTAEFDALWQRLSAKPAAAP